MKLSAALLVLSLAAPLGALEGIQRPAAAQQLTHTDLSAAAAVATADKLLQALEKRDAAMVFTTLASGVRANTSVAAIQKRLTPSGCNGRVIGTNAGYATTTVDAVITSDQGESLLIVLDNDGLLWHGNGTIGSSRFRRLPLNSPKTWLQVVGWRPARNSLQFQEELEPGDLQRKWTKLARTSVIPGCQGRGDRRSGRRAQLVLVTVDFADVTTNLFVIFDRSGRIINVDISRDFV